MKLLEVQLQDVIVRRKYRENAKRTFQPLRCRRHVLHRDA